MELSNQTQKGLALLSSESLQDGAFNKLVRGAVDAACGLTTDEVCDTANAKTAFAALVTLLVEAAKEDAGASTVSGMLVDSGVDDSRAELMAERFEEFKQQIRMRLMGTSFSHPRVVDVDWRLDYYMKNNHLHKVNKPMYLISLKTEEPDGKKGSVEFHASMEQLEDLTTQLKDVTRNLRRVAEA